MNQIFFFLPLVCLKGVNYKLEYLKSKVSQAGPGLLGPGAPQLGEGPGCLLLWQPGSEPQARDDPTLLFRPIQLHQCTEKALFDLNIKFYSFFLKNFFPGGAREGRVVSKVHF